MSDSKRATLITVGAPKSAKNNVTKTVRLYISLDESNEHKYPELNYKELVIAEEKKSTKTLNGKTPGLDPFSDNDDDVESVARKFEQKYGGKSTYGSKKRTKHNDFADIGAGYDENDSFIDNTDGYDEMIPPECDTLYGGFYINSGSLEFKTVPENQLQHSDSEPSGHRRNKRRISSSSSEDSSESSSESSREAKDKAAPNGALHDHDTEHRKKKKKHDKKAKRIRRNDSSAATSGKQTSDDNGDPESADSRTSQSDSLTSKPAPSSENAATSDSSRDIIEKTDTLPPQVRASIDEIKNFVARKQLENVRISIRDVTAMVEPYLVGLEKVLAPFENRVKKSAWGEVAKMLNTSRSKLVQRIASLSSATQQSTAVSAAAPAAAAVQPPPDKSHKRPAEQDFDRLSSEEREALIVDTLNKLKTLIEEKTPAMMANYKIECDRVQEERKKQQSLPSGPHVEKRMPKRRFPWCAASRALLARLARLGGAPLLERRALPLFPPGFARRPTLLRQADIKPEFGKRQRANSTNAPQAFLPTPAPPPAPPALPAPLPKPHAATKTTPTTFSEPIQFPSSLTVTTTLKTSPDKSETIVVSTDDKKESQFPKMPTSITITKEEEKREDKYVPPNSIGSITITPVTNSKEKKADKQKEPLIRVKTPAILMKEANDIAKKDKPKKASTPLHVETNFQAKDKPSPNYNKKDEDKIPRPGLIPVHLSPTFAKPDKRPPDAKKKKDILIVSDVDPLSDAQAEPVQVDDSSSDVELIEDKEKVPSAEPTQKMNVDEADADTDIDAVMRNLREMQDSQEQNFNSNSFGSVIKSDQNSLNKMDGCSVVTG